MKHSVFSRRIEVVSTMLVAALVMGRAAPAQGVPSTESVVFTFEGFVVALDGLPAEGAVVVSSAGGQAVTDAGGSFRLEAQVPLDAESIQISAIGRAGGNRADGICVRLYAAITTLSVHSPAGSDGSGCCSPWRSPWPIH